MAQPKQQRQKILGLHKTTKIKPSFPKDKKASNFDICLTSSVRLFYLVCLEVEEEKKMKLKAKLLQERQP